MNHPGTEPPPSILENNEALVDFFNGVMDRATTFVQHFDTQTNILVGISTAVSALAVSGIREEIEFTAFLVLGAFSTLSVIIGLYAIHPPKFMRKKEQEESIFYNKKIIQHGSGKDYAKSMTEALKDKDNIVLQYSTELYNIFRYYYRPKRILFKLSRNLLMAGIIIGGITYFIEKFY